MPVMPHTLHGYKITLEGAICHLQGVSIGGPYCFLALLFSITPLPQQSFPNQPLSLKLLFTLKDEFSSVNSGTLIFYACLF